MSDMSNTRIFSFIFAIRDCVAHEPTTTTTNIQRFELRMGLIKVYFFFRLAHNTRIGPLE